MSSVNCIKIAYKCYAIEITKNVSYYIWNATVQTLIVLNQKICIYFFNMRTSKREKKCLVFCIYCFILRKPSYESWPQSAIEMVFFVFPLWLPKPSIFLITSMPSTTVPKTTWRLSNQDVFTVVMKNCEPFVFGPALACTKNKSEY